MNWISRIQGLAQTKWVRSVAFALAVVVFGLGIYLSLRAQPSLIHNLRWRPFLVLVIAGVPATLFLQALEFSVLSRLMGKNCSMATGARVVILGSAANILPVPGAIGVRIVALGNLGTRVATATLATTLVAILWLAVALAYGGSWLLGINGTVSYAFLGSGVILLGVTTALLAKNEGGLPITLQLVGIKALVVFFDAIRLYVCLLALGLTPSVLQASVLTSSSAMGAAVLVVPAGLGVQEAVAALLSPLVGLGGAFGFMAATVNRLATMTVFLPVAGFLARVGFPSPPASPRNNGRSLNH